MNGWLILDKAIGISSAQAVARVKRLYSGQKSGHGGTLDPFASGILPIAVGEARKVVNYIMDKSKSYEFTVVWGEETDTLDTEGKVIRTSAHLPGETEIRAVLQGFIGEIEQVPPAYSAIKVKGRRAYDLSRRGEVVELAARRVLIEGLRLMEHEGGRSKFYVDCGKGTYIRALARDIAYKLGTVCFVSELRRTRVGKFSLESAICMDYLEELVHSGRQGTILHPIQSVLDDILVLWVSDGQAKNLMHGQKLDVMSVDRGNSGVECGTWLAKLGDQPIALCKIEDGLVKPLRVFNNY